MKRIPKRNPIQIQQDYIDTMTAAYGRWKHREGVGNVADGVGGHYSRIHRKAHKVAMKQLRAWGYTYSMSLFLVNQAHDILLLERATNWWEKSE